MILKRKKIFAVVLFLLLISSSTICYAQNNSETTFSEADPRIAMWTYVQTTSGNIGVPEGTYVPGASSYYVRLLQATLNKIGYSCGTADGIYGTNTRNAIIRFQEDKKLTADGVAGSLTWSRAASLAREIGDVPF